MVFALLGALRLLGFPRLGFGSSPPCRRVVCAMEHDNLLVLSPAHLAAIPDPTACSLPRRRSPGVRASRCRVRSRVPGDTTRRRHPWGWSGRAEWNSLAEETSYESPLVRNLVDVVCVRFVICPGCGGAKGDGSPSVSRSPITPATSESRRASSLRIVTQNLECDIQERMQRASASLIRGTWRVGKMPWPALVSRPGQGFDQPRRAGLPLGSLRKNKDGAARTVMLRRQC
jgi:hypothetical protein